MSYQRFSFFKTNNNKYYRSVCMISQLKGSTVSF